MTNDTQTCPVRSSSGLLSVSSMTDKVILEILWQQKNRLGFSGRSGQCRNGPGSDIPVVSALLGMGVYCSLHSRQCLDHILKLQWRTWKCVNLPKPGIERSPVSVISLSNLSEEHTPNFSKPALYMRQKLFSSGVAAELKARNLANLMTKNVCQNRSRSLTASSNWGLLPGSVSVGGDVSWAGHMWEASRRLIREMPRLGRYSDAGQPASSAKMSLSDNEPKISFSDERCSDVSSTSVSRSFSDMDESAV